MKAYTDLPQSKKLAKFLPLESADMTCIGTEFIPYPYCESKFKGLDNVYPAWSLTALLNVLPKEEYKDIIDLCFGGYQGGQFIAEWFCSYEQQEPFLFESCHADNPVDACVEMIVKLHKMNLL